MTTRQAACGRGSLLLWRCFGHRLGRLALVGLALLLTATVWAAESPAWNAARQEVQAALASARSAYSNEPASGDLAWKLGRAYFDAGEFATSKRERADLAELGMAACKRAVELQSNSAPAHYYWGLNLGQLARTRGISALRLVVQMRNHFQAALQLDEKFDNAGSHRNLGYLFRDAPSWGSIGDRAKAKYHLQKAVELATDFPENWLALLEGRIQWGEKDLARQELERLQRLWPDAKARLTGPVWEVAWDDWERQLANVRRKLAR